LDQFVRELRRMMAQRRVANRNDAREAVWAAAYLAQMHLGLRPSATIFEYTAAMLGGLDEYSTFLTRSQLDDLYSPIEGNFVGLGVELKADAGTLLIVNVVSNSPAERAGIKPGDRIVEVAGRSMDDVTTDQAAELLQGVEGSVAELVVQTDGESPRALAIR